MKIGGNFCFLGYFDLTNGVRITPFHATHGGFRSKGDAIRRLAFESHSMPSNYFFS
jgi:hypothetical protein